jgi:hypothetical protein
MLHTHVIHMLTLTELQTGEAWYTSKSNVLSEIE